MQLPRGVPARAVSPPPAAPLHVLVVEDERDLGGVLADYLTEIGHRPEVVGSAETALERLGAEPPDAIILDVKLPGMTGLEFLSLRAVRESGVPVIVVSGYVTEDQARDCLRLGALEFLAKPVPLEVLRTVLEHIPVIGGGLGQTPHVGERRTATRFPVTLPLRATTEQGVVAAGAVIDVSATGLRARVDHALRPGTAARLAVALADGGPAVDALALVVRSDGEHMVAFWFLDLTPGEIDRLLARAHAAR
jgi:CheY-like chemotaxis protein